MKTNVGIPVVCGHVRDGRVSDPCVRSVLSHHEDDEDDDEDEQDEAQDGAENDGKPGELWAGKIHFG